VVVVSLRTAASTCTGAHTAPVRIHADVIPCPDPCPQPCHERELPRREQGKSGRPLARQSPPVPGPRPPGRRDRARAPPVGLPIGPAWPGRWRRRRPGRRPGGSPTRPARAHPSSRGPCSSSATRALAATALLAAGISPTRAVLDATRRRGDTRVVVASRRAGVGAAGCLVFLCPPELAMVRNPTGGDRDAGRQPARPRANQSR